MSEMAKITAICNQKGGVGKTVTAVNLGIGLAREGKADIVLISVPGVHHTGRKAPVRLYVIGQTDAPSLFIFFSIEASALLPSGIRSSTGAMLHNGGAPLLEYQLWPMPAQTFC